MLRFEDPWLLLLGLLLIPILYLYGKGEDGARIQFSTLAPFREFLPPKGVYLRHLLITLRCLGLAFLIIALARPQAGQKESEIITEGIDIMLSLDTSGSMRALDFKLNDLRADRLAVVKKVVKEFIEKRRNDRIGMVVFGDNAFSSLSFDKSCSTLLPASSMLSSLGGR